MFTDDELHLIRISLVALVERCNGTPEMFSDPQVKREVEKLRQNLASDAYSLLYKLTFSDLSTLTTK